MKNLKTKTCANSVCGKSFNFKSPKKIYCCQHCKNQASYNFRLKEYAWEVNMQKLRNKNIQILEYLWRINMVKILREELRKMGFDFISAYIFITDDQGNAIFRYGNIGLKLLSETEVKLFEFKND